MDLEQEFERAIRGMITNTLHETKYRPTLFMQMVDRNGAMDTCLRLVRTPTPSDGFTTLWELGRLDLTAETHMLAPKFEALFEESDLMAAKKRLEDYGYSPGSPK